MLIELAQHVVADAKAREAEGDCPSPRRYSAEQVEAALVTVADALLAAEAERDALRGALKAGILACKSYCTPYGRAGSQPTSDESRVHAIGDKLARALTEASDD